MSKPDNDTLRVLLVRPGATAYDEQGRIQGTLDVPLSDAGCAEVARAVEPLRAEQVEVIYTSPCQSAAETAQHLAAALDLKLKVLDGLQNLNHGLWQGMRVDEVKEKQPKVYKQWQEHPENVRPPEGEMLAEVRRRVEPIVARLTKRHKRGTIGLVVPEPLASVVASLMSQEEVGDLWSPAACGSWEMIPLNPAPASR